MPFSAAGCPPPTPLLIHDKDQRSPDARESHQEERIGLLHWRYPCLALLQTGQTNSDQRAFAHAPPSALTTFPRCQLGLLPSLRSDASSVSLAVGEPGRGSPSLPPASSLFPLITFPIGDHVFAVCSSLCLRMGALCRPTCHPVCWGHCLSLFKAHLV